MGETRIDGPRGALTVDDGGAKGDLPPVLFVHSDGGNATHWSAQTDRLRPARRALALDLRGHGRSEVAKDGDYSVRGRSEDVTAVADALGLDRFVLVGHSGGSAVSLCTAGSHPARMAGLLLVDPAIDQRGMPEAEARGLMDTLRSSAYEGTLQSYFRSIAGENPEVVERVLADALATPQEAVVGTFAALLRFDPTPFLRSYRGPRLSLVTPPMDTPAGYHRLDEELPHRVVEGTGHWLHLDDPTAFGAALDGFLATVDADEGFGRGTDGTNPGDGKEPR